MPIADFAPRYLKRSIKKVVTSVSKGSKQAEISPEEFYRAVQLKAYELYEQRAGADGSEIDDWVKAESLIKSQYEKSAS
jgi:lipoate-protein ligase A